MHRPKRLLPVCCVMIVTGLLLSGTGYLLGGRVWGIGLNMDGVWVNSPNVQGRTGYSYLKETRELDAFTGIDAELDFGELIVEPSDHYGISYYLPEDCGFAVGLEDGVLRVVRESHPAFGIQGDLVSLGIGTIGTRWENEYVKISIPAGAEFGTVKLASDSGGITAGNLRAESVVVNAGFGDVELTDLTCERADIQLDSGCLTLTGFGDGTLTIGNQFGEAVLDHVTARETEITMESGDFKASDADLGSLVLVQKFGAVRFDGVTCGAAEITSESGGVALERVIAEELNISSDFGDIDGEGVSAQTAELKLGSGACSIGALDVPDLTVQSSFGDVRLELVCAAAEYALDLCTDFGTVEIDRRDMGSAYQSLETREKSLTVRCDSGDIRVRSGE